MMMRHTYMAIVVLAGLLFPNLILAQAIPINTIIQRVLIQHPDIVSAQAQKEALLKAVEQSQVRYNPEFEIGVGRKNDGISSGGTLETTLKQTLLYPGKLDAKKALAGSEVLLQENEIQRLKVALANVILLKAFQWNDSIQRQAINQKRIQKLNWIKAYLTSRPFASPQKRLEFKLIESHLKSYQMEDIQLTALSRSNQLAIAKWVSGPLSQMECPEVPKGFLDLTSGKTDLADKNPDIQTLKIRLVQLALETNHLEVDAQPNFDVFGRYASESASGMDQFFSVGLGMDLPFSNKNRFAIQGQAHKKKALELQLVQMLKEKETQWQEASIALTRSQDILALYNPTWIIELESSLDASIDGFEKGQTELLSVLDLESQWVTAINTRYDAQVEWMAAYVTLRQLLGKTEFLGELL